MHVLRLHCVDQPGIVAAVAGTLATNQCNIEESSQFFDPYSGRFFMRVVFRPLTDEGLGGFRHGFRHPAERFAMDWEICDLKAPVRTLVLVSRADHCLHDLLYRWRTRTLSIDIAGVASNHGDLKPLADADNVRFVHLPIVGDDKAAHEASLQKLITDYDCDLIILARYMQVLSKEFCDLYQGRLINIHHSFLPGFKGARPYHQAYERGVKIIGATAHFVTSDLDEGPIITQDVEPVSHADDPEKLQHLGKEIESRVLARAVRLYTERRIFLHGSRTVIL